MQFGRRTGRKRSHEWPAVRSYASPWSRVFRTANNHARIAEHRLATNRATGRGRRKTPRGRDQVKGWQFQALRLTASFVCRLAARCVARRPVAKSNPPSPVAAELLVNSFYKVAFGRFAEPEGLAHHIRRLQSGASAEDLAEEFVRSAEFKARHGSDQRVDALYLVALYRDGLGRHPDPKGLKGWLAEAEKGATRAEVLASFARSAEALEKISLSIRPPTCSNGLASKRAGSVASPRGR